jgi:hypothetical protein
MNPDVAEAIGDLVRRGVLPESKAVRLRSIARGELVSLYPELRLLFYIGVLLSTAGIGVLVKQNYENIGPVVIATGLGAAALGTLLWVARTASPFSWKETPVPYLAFDYLLLLGVLLAAADLAFIEVQFTPLGSNWPWHLLIVSLIMACFAVRYDSRTLFSLALSTFAAWRGLSVSILEKQLWRATEDIVRWNALGCGILFVLLGRGQLRSGRKPHFEPVTVHLGWLLILGALVSGGQEQGLKGIAHILALGLTGSGLAWYAFRRRRFALFTFGILALYVSASQLVLKSSLDFMESLFWFVITSAGLIAWLWKVQRKMREVK